MTAARGGARYRGFPTRSCTSWQRMEASRWPQSRTPGDGPAIGCDALDCAGEKLVFDAIARRIDQVGPGRAYPNERSDSAVTPTMDWAMVARLESDPWGRRR